MALSEEDLNEIDHWILAFLAEHEWATPNPLRQFSSDEIKEVSRQWVSNRIGRLVEYDHSSAFTRMHTRLNWLPTQERSGG